MGKGVKSDGEKRKRSVNFTSAEVEILIKEVEARKQILFGELKGPNLTKAHRDRACSVVSEKVNAVSPVVRTVQDLKSKFSDMKTRTKQKANKIFREAKKTGGGQNTAEKLSNSEQLLRSFVGKESIEGIPGGFDIGIPNDIQQLLNDSHTNEEEIILRPPSNFASTEEEREEEEPNVETTPQPSDILINEPITSATPKQKTTFKKSFLDVSKETNLHLNNIVLELRTLNQTLKRTQEINEELLHIKKNKFI